MILNLIFMQNPQDIAYGMPINQPIQGYGQPVMQDLPIQNQLIPSIIRVIKKVIPFAIVGGIGYIAGRNSNNEVNVNSVNSIKNIKPIEPIKKEPCSNVKFQVSQNNKNNNDNPYIEEIYGKYSTKSDGNIRACLESYILSPSIISFCADTNNGRINGDFFITQPNEMIRQNDITFGLTLNALLDNEIDKHSEFTKSKLDDNKKKGQSSLTGLKETRCESIKRF